MTITTDYPVNFTKAEDDTFSWNSSWGDFLYHKPSGRSIYQMTWTDTKTAVEPEIKNAASGFFAELKNRQTCVHNDPISDAEYNRAEAFERRMNDPHSDL